MKTFDGLIAEVSEITVKYVQDQIESQQEFMGILNDDPKLKRLYDTVMKRVDEEVGGNK